MVRMSVKVRFRMRIRFRVKVRVRARTSLFAIAPCVPRLECRTAL